MAVSIVQNIDCMIAMKEFPDKFFDLAIVDPPYGIGEDGKSNHSRGAVVKIGSKRNLKYPSTQFTPKNWDKKPPDKDYFIELKRISKNQIIFGANHFIENIPNANSSAWVVWNKVNGETHQSDCELAYTSFKTAVREVRYKWNGMLVGDMKHKEKRIHPTQKPIHLYAWILQQYAKVGNKILDTHLGSGSSRIAASNLGFDFWGYEADEEYFNDQEKRFNKGTENTLFSNVINHKPESTNLFDL